MPSSPSPTTTPTPVTATSTTTTTASSSRSSSVMATTTTTSKPPPFLLIPANNAHYAKQQALPLALPASFLPVPNPPPPHVHFKVPAHMHSHHLHSIPPRHKSTRSLILDQMIHEQFNTRLASVRAELGLSIPSGLAAAEREHVWKQRHFALPFVFDEKELAIDFANQSTLDGSQSQQLVGYNPPRVPNQTLASQLYAKAQGISNVVRASVSQPPHPLTHSTTSHSHHSHHHHDDRIPNGVRFRLLLAILADVHFSPRSTASAGSESNSEIPQSVANFVALSSFKLSHQHHPTLPPIKSILNNASPPSATSSSPASPFTSFTASGVSPRTTSTPTFFGQQQSVPAPRKNSSGSATAFGSGFGNFLGKAPPQRSNSGDSATSNKGEGASSAPFPRAMQMQSGWVPSASQHDKSSSSSTTASQLFSTPITRTSTTSSQTHCTRHLRPSSSCNSPTCPQTNNSSSSWAYKKQTIIGAGLDTKSLSSLASGVVPSEPHMITTLKIFIRLSALVCAEVMEDSRRAAEALMREGSPMQSDDSSSSSSEEEDEMEGVTSTGTATHTQTNASDSGSRRRKGSPVVPGIEKYIPQREWYALLVGIVTRAVLEGYLLHGWKETKALEVLFGLGSASQRPSSSATRDGEAVAKEEQREYDPDGYLGLRESYWSLFPSASASSSEGGEALKEFRGEMARRKEEFLTLSPSKPGSEHPTLESHLMQLNEKYPPESVERMMVRFCEGCGRWKGAGELDPPSASASKELSSGISTVSSAASFPSRSGGAVKTWFAAARKLSVNTRLANTSTPSSFAMDKNGAPASVGSKRARSGSLSASPRSPDGPGRERKNQRV